MKRIWQAGLLSTVMLGSLGAAAVQAQSFHIDIGNGYHRFFGDRDNYRYFNPWRREHRFERVMSDREARLDSRINGMRNEINERLSEGRISPERASRLNARLADIANDSSASAGTGTLTDARMAQLEARLNNVQFAMSGGSRWY